MSRLFCILRCFAFGVALASPACSVDMFQAAPKETGPTNQCSADSDCGTSGYCSGSVCYAPKGEISNIIVEVLPPASAFYGAGDSFLLSLNSVLIGDPNRQLELPQYARVVGSVTLPDDDPVLSQSCKAGHASDGSLAVHVELSRSSASIGLPASTFAANATAPKAGWFFEATVPPDKYDIYITTPTINGCAYPPILLPSTDLSGNPTLPIKPGYLKRLTGTVDVPSGLLEKWSIQLIEPVNGRLISTVRSLSGSSPTNFELTYYSPPTGVSPMIQISPPSGIKAPRVVWDLAAVDLANSGKVGLSISPFDLSTVHVSARIEQLSSLSELPDATLILRSTHLSGISAGLSAGFETTAKTASDGSVQVDLLPGTYRAFVIPSEVSNLSITEVTWEIASQPSVQAGRTIQVPARAFASGIVLDPGGTKAIPDATLVASPSVDLSVGALERLLGQVPVKPRVSSVISGADGAFLLPLDPGVVDVTVSFSKDTNFPSIVFPRKPKDLRTLGSLRIPLPVAIQGQVRDPSGNPVQRAVLRAYAPLDASAKKHLASSFESADGTVRVGEVQTDQAGHYRFLLPSLVFP